MLLWLVTVAQGAGKHALLCILLSGSSIKKCPVLESKLPVIGLCTVSDSAVLQSLLLCDSTSAMS